MEGEWNGWSGGREWKEEGVGESYYTPGRGKIVPRNVMQIINHSLPCEWPTKNLTTSS